MDHEWQSEPRNRFVLRDEGGHPGFSSVVVLATQDDLRKLAEQLRTITAAPKARIEHHATREHQPTSLGSIVFQAISEDELCELQEGDWKLHAPRRVFWTLFTLLAVYGAWSLFT
jgi:hypothetical protein